MFDNGRSLLGKLLSTIMCATLILSMVPSTIINAEESNNAKEETGGKTIINEDETDSQEEVYLKVNLIDYVDTYYQGFNDNICMAQGTTIQIEYNGNVGMFVAGNAYEKDSDKEIIYSVVSDDEEDMGKAEITFADGQVHLKWYAPDDRVYEKDLYEPQYLPLDSMPIVGLDEEKTIASEDVGSAVCERYYRIDAEAGAYIAYTAEIDPDCEDDTYICLYDEEGKIIDYNDDGENAPYSFLAFDVEPDEDRIIGVKNYDYENGININDDEKVDSSPKKDEKKEQTLITENNKLKKELEYSNNQLEKYKKYQSLYLNLLRKVKTNKHLFKNVNLNDEKNIKEQYVNELIDRRNEINTLLKEDDILENNLKDLLYKLE